MPRRSPVWLLVSALALATGLTLLALGSLLVEPPGPGPALPTVASTLPDGRLADRRPDDAPTDLSQPLLRAVVDLPAPSPLTLRLVRITFAPGAWLHAVVLPGPALFATEAGTLTLWADGRAGVGRVAAAAPLASAEPVTPMVDLVVRSGGQVLLPAGTVFALRNMAPTPAVVLGMAVFPGGDGSTKPFGWALFRPPPSPTADAGAARWEGPVQERPGAAWSLATAPAFEGWPADVTVQPLASAEVSLGPGPATLAVGRWTLAPGAGISSPNDGPALLVVEAGLLGLQPRDGAARPLSSSENAARNGTPTGTELLAAAGDAVVVQRGAGDAGRNAGEGPLVVLALTIGRDAP
jgi:hypothetical protein